ncbi:MAG: BON domain-containing protein [Candidatus Sulfotelmatobacter sp.]|jgi:hyperosmotically inducible protein
MKSNLKTVWGVSITLIFAIALTLACSDRPPKVPDVAGDIRHALDQAGLNSVSVSQDRDKAVVSLTGDVGTDDDKARAESIARSIAGTEVVSNEIGVRPGGEEGIAKKVDADLDSAIDKNLEAMLVQHRLRREVHYDVTNGVVTLKGDVASRSQRASVEKLAERVPNVKQVVNELEVKHERATSAK